MNLYTLDPMLDGRWDELVAAHPNASVFHQMGWLKALARSYGYRPLVLTSTPPGTRLLDGIVFCEIKSWITGSRLVSVPFADHVEPLLSKSGSLELTGWFNEQWREESWKYIELRPLSWGPHSNSVLTASQSYWFHTLDLTPSPERLFCNLHKNCIQRRVRRADRENLSYEKGSSEELVEEFYKLLMITRRRHHLLPQPRAWFRDLVACMSPNVEIRMARKERVPIAALLTLKNRDTVVFKYGCSNEKFHHLAGMPLLFWRLIEESKGEGAAQIDFGRTDLDNGGLIRFKDRLGTSRKPLTYFRFPGRTRDLEAAVAEMPATRRLFSVLPDALSSRAGGLVYRHIG